MAHVVVPGVSSVGVSCELLLVLGRIVPQRGLSRSVKVARQRHGLIDLASNVSSCLVRADSVVSHARDRVANAFYRDTSEHL